MCPVRREMAILCLMLGTAPVLSAQPGSAEHALRDAGMADVLEAYLLDVLSRTTDDAKRTDLIDRLVALYTDLLRALPAGSPERADVVVRAWALAESAGEARAMDLRLVLLLERYGPHERAAELFELGLLSDRDRAEHIEDLRSLHARFRGMAQSAINEAASIERRQRSTGTDPGGDAVRKAVRQRSLACYYAAWSGLTLAVLEQRVAGPEVLRWFGWLLGSTGEIPRLDDLMPSMLELDHVARSVIGVGRARAMSGEWMLAEQWLRAVIGSDLAAAPLRAQATARLLRAKADQGAWIEVVSIIGQIDAKGGEGSRLPTPEARYVAIRALQARAQSSAGSTAEKVAGLAMQDLIERGEIGHVLDLRDRYGAIGVLGSGFIGLYADGLDRLDSAQKSGTPGMFLDAASKLTEAAEARDANSFPVQRDDARLKAAFCEIRGGRPRQALTVVRAVLAGAPVPGAEEEAAWLLIVAMDELQDARLKPDMTAAVRAYLARYPGTPRSARLLLRHAGTEVLEPGAAADGLRAIDESDPIVLGARRVLARMVYRLWIDSRRADRSARDEAMELIRWVWQREESGDDPGAPRDRLDLARIGIDMALGAAPVDLEMADHGLARARRAIEQDVTLARFTDELDLRGVEIESARGRLHEADRLAEGLRRSVSPLSGQADRVLLSAILRRLDNQPEDEVAAELGVRIGTRVSAELIPPIPQSLSPDASRVLDRIWRLIATRAEQTADSSLSETALRLGRVVLERGSPTAQGLRDLATLAARLGDADTELQAWSVLLGASREDEPVWWESRYHTLRLLLARDEAGARRAYEQHRVLHPMPGLLPWTRMIDELFFRAKVSDDESPSGVGGGP